MNEFKTEFYGLKTLPEVKAKYHKLAKIYHPDTGGSEEQMKLLTAAFEWAVANVYRLAAMQDAQEKGYDFDDARVSAVAEILRQVIALDCRLEIIGSWLYAFEAYNIKDELKALEFWFSVKHKAWVYNGRSKNKHRSCMTTDEVREKYGSQKVPKPQKAALAGG